ncbi:MAG: DUF1801 domain-containing protein [Thermomicrobiales bacterium]
MQSNATSVDAYIAEAPPERQPVMSAIRDLCLAHLPGYEESMRYGMATYTRNGEAEFAFASQKGYLSLYGMKQGALDPLRDEFTGTGAKIGKGCVRYSKPEKVNLEALARLLQATAASDEGPC